MRPALFRLLKRPSAISVLDSLIASPFGIDHLNAGLQSRCIRCQTQSARPGNAIEHIESKPPVNNDICDPSTKRPFTLRVYEIQSPSENAELEYRYANSLGPEYPSINVKHLGLQPDKLEFESDVGHANDIGSRLVDNPKYRNDFALWEELLRYRQRRYGDQGTLDIWEGLITRVGGLELPVEGERADFFWESFVALGFKREIIMKELDSYALELWNNTGKRWNMLHQSVVGGFLERGMTSQAVGWHRRLQKLHLSMPNDIIHLLRPAISLTSGRGIVASELVKPKGGSTALGLSAFREICKSTDGHRIYETVISTLVGNGEFAEAFRMHNLLVSRGDIPQAYEDLQPLIEYAREYGPSNVYEKLYRYAAHRFGKGTKASNPTLPSGRGQTPESNGEAWLEEKRFRDDFGARIFATKALNFDMILSGLKMFGVPAIGPRSLREMAVRARGSQDIMEKLRRLEKEGISVGESLFARLLRKLATENREILVSDLLRSDQHPDVLEDTQLQESLLVSNYLTRDWRQYNLTLAVLGELHGEALELSNIHFRKYIAARELVLASKVVDEMALTGTSLSRKSIDFMIEHVLRLRKPGAGPSSGGSFGPKDEVTFVCRILQRIVPMGTYISPQLWVELIKRLGMTDNWDELRTCCLWLSRHYSPLSARPSVSWAIASSPNRVRPAETPLPQIGDHQMLQRIFTRQMQAAIVAWGFKIQPPSKLQTYPRVLFCDERLVPFVRGLLLLHELKGNGVQLHSKILERACTQRLTVLFGRPRQSNRRINRELRKNNPYSLEEVTADIRRVCGEDEPASSLGPLTTQHKAWG